MKGYSPRNLKYMGRFADAWADAEIFQQAVGQLSCSHQLRLLEKLPNALPAELQTSLPCIEQIERMLGGIEQHLKRMAKKKLCSYSRRKLLKNHHNQTGK